MPFDYNKYMADIQEFMSICESEGYKVTHFDERKMTINFEDPSWDRNGVTVFDSIDDIEDIAYEVFSVGWIYDIRPVGRDGIVLKYFDFYIDDNYY